MSARIKTSEPAYRAPISQSQRDRMGRVQPMKRVYYWPLESHGETLPMSSGERAALKLIVLVAVLVCAALEFAS